MCVCVYVCVPVLLYLSKLPLTLLHITTQNCIEQKTTACLLLSLFYFLTSCAIKSLCCLVCSHPHFSVCPPLKHPDSPCLYATIPIDMTWCPFLSRSLLGQAWMCVIVQLVVCIWLQEQLFVMGGFGMRGCGPGSNPMSHCSDLVYFCGGLVTAGTTGLKVC